MADDGSGGADVAVEIHAGEEAPGGPEGGQPVVEAETVEAAADAAVEVARIEADRDVRIAEVEADVREHEADAMVEQVEAMHAAAETTELEQCRLTIARLEGELEALRSSTLPPSVVTVVEEPPSPPPVVEPESESTAEGGPRENPAEAAPAPEPEKPKRRPHRWI